MSSIPSGRARNIGFSFLGLGTPFGFSIGLVLGGIFEATIGWRLGFYISSGCTLFLFVINFWYLPQDREMEAITWARLRRDIDWIGALISSTGLGLLSYIFA